MTLVNIKLTKVITQICVITFSIINNNAQNINFVDNNFKQALLDYDNPIIDTDADGEISYAEAELITELDIHNKNIFNLTGINHFINLETLDCWENAIGTLNLDLPLLTYLDCNNSGVVNLNLSNLSNLDFLYCGRNFISNLDLSDNSNLTELICNDNFISFLDLSNNLLLERLILFFNPLTQGINVSQNLNLKELYTSFSNIINIEVSNNENLEILDCSNCWSLENITLGNNINLKELFILNATPYNSSLNLNNCGALERLNINNSGVANLDISNNFNLKSLGCNNTNIVNLNFSMIHNLEVLGCSENDFLESLNLKNNLNLTVFDGDDNPLLNCIEVSNEYDAQNGEGIYENWTKDAWTVYSEDCSTVSVNDFENITFNIYPNPVKDVLLIENNNNLSINSIKVFSPLGRLIINSKNINSQIDLSNLNKGTWFLKIETESGNITKKIIKI